MFGLGQQKIGHRFQYDQIYIQNTFIRIKILSLPWEKGNNCF